MLVESVSDPQTLKDVRKHCGTDALQNQNQANGEIKKNVEELKKKYKEEFPTDSSIDEKLTELEDEIFG